jgi:hypothetical protein
MNIIEALRTHARCFRPKTGKSYDFTNSANAHQLTGWDIAADDYEVDTERTRLEAALAAKAAEVDALKAERDDLKRQLDEAKKPKP